MLLISWDALASSVVSVGGEEVQSSRSGLLSPPRQSSGGTSSFIINITEDKASKNKPPDIYRIMHTKTVRETPSTHQSQMRCQSNLRLVNWASTPPRNARLSARGYQYLSVVVVKEEGTCKDTILQLVEFEPEIK